MAHNSTIKIHNQGDFPEERHVQQGHLALLHHTWNVSVCWYYLPFDEM